MLVNDPNFNAPPTFEAVPAQPRRSLTSRDVLSVLFRRKWIIVQFFVFCSIAGVVASVMMAEYPIYWAEHKVKIVPPERFTQAVLGAEVAPEQEDLRRETLYENYLTVFENPLIYQQVALDLELHKDEHALWQSTGRRFLRRRIAEALQPIASGWFGFDLAPEYTEDDFKGSASSRLKDSLKVGLERDARSIMIVTYQSIFSDTERTRAVVEAVMLRAEELIKEKSRYQQLLALVENRIEPRISELQEAKRAKDEFLAAHDLRSSELEFVLENQRREVDELRTKVEQLELDIENREVDLEYARKAVEIAGKIVRVSALPPASPEELEVQSYRSLRAERKVALRIEESQTTRDTNLIANLKKEIAAYDEAIQEILDRLPEKGEPQELPNYDAELAKSTVLQLEAQKKLATERLAAQERTLGEKVARFEKLQTDLAEGLRIMNQYEESQIALRTVTQKKENLELQMALAQDVPPFEKTIPMDVSGWPITGEKKRIAVVLGGFVFGFFGGIGLAFLRETLDRSVKSVEDVEDVLGLPVIASVPQNRRFHRMLK